MSDIIHLLPDAVANQIAAGEVIQRPASIIKELVENALDAGASRIQIIVEDAGKSLVQVIDNGKGMSMTDARMAFERHATSKIQQATDLFALRTMGFRGEALASIAAVAQVELRTRQASEEIGTCLRIEGSKTIGQEAIACPVGANFAVRNLFFNIPARRKFLKTNQTELTNILAEVERIALAHPDIAISLHSGSQLVLDLAAGNFRKRIVSIFGHRIDAQLVPVDADTTLAHIHGFTGMPSAARKKSANQFLFVNGRYMRHPYFSKAILMAYERLIPEGQQVPFFLNFEVDPARIDVNIHPTKTEIKFEDDSAIFQILLAAVREALGKYGAVPAIDFDQEGSPEIPVFQSASPGEQPHVAPPQIHINTAFNPFQTNSNESKNETPVANPFADRAKKVAPKQVIDWKKVFEESQHSFPTRNPNTPIYNKESESSDFGAETQSFPTDTPTTPPTFADFQSTAMPEVARTAPAFPAFDSSDIPTPDSKTPAVPIADDVALFDNLPEKEKTDWQEPLPTEFFQLQSRYIVTPRAAGLTLIDQHRAHIRILYERYLSRLERHASPSQRLLFPEMLQVSPSESVILEGLLPTLLEVGFDISPLGGGSFSLLATPMGTEGIDPIALIQSILADATSGQANVSESVSHVIAHSLARRVAIPSGKVLGQEEISLLLQELFQTSNPQLTPAGAPILTIINPEKLF